MKKQKKLTRKLKTELRKKHGAGWRERIAGQELAKELNTELGFHSPKFIPLTPFFRKENKNYESTENVDPEKHENRQGD